jgi:hypothetical protein
MLPPVRDSGDWLNGISVYVYRFPVSVPFVFYVHFARATAMNGLLHELTTGVFLMESFLFERFQMMGRILNRTVHSMIISRYFLFPKVRDVILIKADTNEFLRTALHP